MVRAIADGVYVGIAGPAVFVDDNAIVADNSGVFGDLDVRNDADANDEP